MKIYLAGKIGGQREFAKEWRLNVIAMAGHKHTFLNPLRRNLEGMEMTDQTEIVLGDKKDINNSDLVLAYINDGASFGTAMEIMYAYDRQIPVFVVSEKNNLGAWVSYHSVIFPSFEKAFEAIERWFS